MAEWFEDESFWVETYTAVFTEKKFEAAAEEIEKMLRLVRYSGGPVLDLGCGPGRHAVALAQRGLPVTAVDRTRFLLEKAKARASRSEVQVEFVEADMRSFVREGAFQLILSMFTSFGYFGDQSEDALVLSNIRKSLMPGGCCLLDMVGKEILAKNFQPTTSSQAADGTLLLQRHEIFDDWTRIRNRWSVIRGDRLKTFEFYLNIYSGKELRDLMTQVGFAKAELFGSLDGTPYDQNAARLIAVGRL